MLQSHGSPPLDRGLIAVNSYGDPYRCTRKMGGIVTIHGASRHGRHCGGGREPQIEACFEQHGHADLRDEYEWTPLHIAAWAGR